MKHEWQFFLFSALYGVEILFVYDLIRSFRNTWKHKKILIAAGDMLFWLATGIFLFTRLYLWNNGILRWYFFVGLLLGMLVYAVGISPYVVKIVSFFLKRLKMFFSWVNILGKGITKSISKLTGIKNGEYVKSEEEKTACQEADTAK